MQRKQTNYHADYDVSGSSDMKGMAKVFKIVMRSEAHEHVFCSALTFALRYKALDLEKRELQASTR